MLIPSDKLLFRTKNKENHFVHSQPQQGEVNRLESLLCDFASKVC